VDTWEKSLRLGNRLLHWEKKGKKEGGERVTVSQGDTVFFEEKSNGDS